MPHPIRSVLVAVPLLVACMAVAAAPAAMTRNTVTIFAAGSLRGVVGELAAQVDSRYGIKVNPTFGGSGALRNRIEHGAHADLLLSADVGSPRKLAAQGRTAVPPLPFARNRICIVAPRAAGIHADNLVERMLAAGTRVWTSEPVVDPGGDYAAAIFDKIDKLHPGSGATLKARARAIRGATAKLPVADGQNKFVMLFAKHRIDMLVTYCSGVAMLQEQAPELASFEVPPQLDPHPVDGMAVLSQRAAVLGVALYLLSESGQALIAHNDLIPIAGP